jgi:hypothetical protein
MESRRGNGEGDFVLVDPVRGKTTTVITGGRDRSPLEERKESWGEEEVWQGRGRGRTSGKMEGRVIVGEEEEFEDAERQVYEMGERSRERRASVWSIPSRN